MKHCLFKRILLAVSFVSFSGFAMLNNETSIIPRRYFDPENNTLTIGYILYGNYNGMSGTIELYKQMFGNQVFSPALFRGSFKSEDGVTYTLPLSIVTSYLDQIASLPFAAQNQEKTTNVN